MKAQLKQVAKEFNQQNFSFWDLVIFAFWGNLIKDWWGVALFFGFLGIVRFVAAFITVRKRYNRG